jgi:hypothetical protein
MCGYNLGAGEIAIVGAVAVRWFQNPRFYLQTPQIMIHPHRAGWLMV